MENTNGSAQAPRARIIALLGQKGGSGKTTLAVHLAVAAQADGEEVLLLDTDQQASATAWGDMRKVAWPYVINVLPSQVKEACASASGTLVVIDTPPHATPETVRACMDADLLILPCRPTPLDLHAINAAVAIACGTGKPAAIVLSSCPPRAAEIPEAQAFLEKHGLPVIPTRIGHRLSYARALGLGRAVTEFEPKGKAAEEIRAVWAWCKERLP